MGRMPPKSKPKESGVTAGTSSGRGGRAATRVTRSTPSKIKVETTKSPSPRRRGPTATATSETAGPSTAKGKGRGGTAEPETPSKNVQKASPKKAEEKEQKSAAAVEKTVAIIEVDEDSRDNEADPLSSIDKVASLARDHKDKGHKDISSSSDDDEDSDDTVPFNPTKSLTSATAVPEPLKRPGPLSKTMVGNTPDKNKKIEENKAKSKQQIDEEETQQSENPTTLKKKKKRGSYMEIKNRILPKKDVFDELNGKRIEIPDTLEPEPSEVDSDDPDHEKVKKSRNNMEQVLLQEGTNIFATMESTDVHELLRRIDSQCTPMDRVSIARREKAIDWDSVAFSSFGPRQCKAIWVYLRHHARSFRIMSEVVSEIKAKFTSDKAFQSKLVESLPGYPRKPPTAQGSFHCYNREKWEKTKRNHTDDLPNFITFQNQCRKEYEALPIEVKAKYQRQSEEAAALYKQEVKAFYAENPGIAQYLAKQFRHKETPVKKVKNKTEGSLNITSKVADPYEDAPLLPQSPVASFINAKLNRINPPATGDDLSRMKHHFYDKYKNLSDKKRVKWIDSCIQDCIMYFDYVKEYQVEHPGFKPHLKLGTLLKAEEQILWENANGKPENPKSAASELFCDEFEKSGENADLSEEERRTIAMQKWNEMDWYHKEMYTMKFKISVVEYRKQIQEFFAKVPEFMKPYTLRRIHRKFWKMLEDVDKEVDVKIEQIESPSEMLITADHGVVMNDGSSHKPKKSKKRKREQEDAQDLGLYGIEGEEEGDRYILDSEFGDNITAPKKKKKKKKRHDDDDEDGYADDDIPNSSNFIQTHLKSKTIAEKETERMYGAGDRVAYELDQNFVQQHKHSAKYFPQGNKVSQNDIYEAVRGIFDSRNHLGRKFTVYYYYAKYVATEKVWIDLMCEKGLEEAAKNIINTFLALPGAQQEIFVEKSKEFHKAKRYTEDFPDQPVPPPKNPKGVYTRDLIRKKTKKATRPTPWHDLPEKVQIFYMKRLYHETKIYMRNYDAFISNLTPSDLVNYAIYRYRKWESRMYITQSIAQAKQQFVFPFQETEQRTIHPIGNELQLVRNYQRDSKFGVRYRKESNPFTELDSAIEKASRPVTYVAKRKKWTGEKAQWDEVDEKVVFSLLLSKEETRRYKLKAFEMYNYPLDEILPKIEPTPDQEEEIPTPRCRIISEGTQTDWTSMSIVNGPITFNSTPTQTTLSYVKKQNRNIPLDGLERFKGKDLETYQRQKSRLVNDVHTAITKVIVPRARRKKLKACTTQQKVSMKQIFANLQITESGMSETKQKQLTQCKKKNNSNTAARKRVAVAKKRSNSNYSTTNNNKKAKPSQENKRKRGSTSKKAKKTLSLTDAADAHIVELEVPSSSKSNQTGPISTQHEQPEVHTIIENEDIESYVNIAPLTPVAEFYGDIQDGSISGQCGDILAPVTSFPVEELDENEVNILTLL